MVFVQSMLRVHLEGPLLIGGHSSPNGFLDAATARDERGIAHVPASALKGALREACVRLARGAGKKVCSLERPCPSTSRTASERCAVCRLFGAPGALVEEVLEGQRDPGSAGALTFSDARASDAHEEADLGRSVVVRHGVAIDRKLRSAEPERLYAREVLDAPRDRWLESSIRGTVEEEDWALFVAALRLVDGIGNSRSRGLGHVRLELVHAGVHSGAGLVLPKHPPAGGIGIVDLEALEPLLLGGFPPTGSLIDSQAFIAGSAIRGAIGTAAASVRRDELLLRILAPDTGLRFSDAYPVGRSDDLPVPVPLSSLACKYAKRPDHCRNGVTPRPADGLLGLAFASTVDGAVATRACPICGEPMQRARGHWPIVEVPTRIVTRLARDVATGSALEGQLYSSREIERGQRFRGTVAGLGVEAFARLTEVSEGAELRIGRGRHRGLGHVKLTIRPVGGGKGAPDIRQRQRAFEQGTQDVAKTLGQLCFGGAAISLIPALATTPVDLPPASAAQAIARALFGDAADRARVLATAVSIRERSGWDDGGASGVAGPRPLRPVIAEGSSWLLAHPKEIALNLDAARRLEFEGLGDFCELGLGRLALFHALFGGNS